MAKSMKILCANLRYSGAKDGTNSWPARKGLCIEVLQSRHPDLLCFQEMWQEQGRDVQEGFPGYDWLGMADEPTGKNNVNAIFYRQEAFSRISSGGYWLSKTPHIPGSSSWDSDCVRLANWTRLVHLETKKEFRLINTHLDHISQAARENQARVIDEDSRAYPASYPQILTGDMNCDLSNPVISYLLENGWRDTYQTIRGVQDPGFTFHEFAGQGYVSPLGKIDWIFTRGKIEVVQAEIVRNGRNGRYPSDHYFLFVEVAL